MSLENKANKVIINIQISIKKTLNILWLVIE